MSTRRYILKPSKKILKIHHDLTKRQRAFVVQIRTEKIGLNDFLYSQMVSGITDPGCECGEGRQTVDHILLQCQEFNELQVRKLGRLQAQGDLRKILNEHVPAIKAIKFMEQTQILGHYRNMGADRRS